MHSFTVSYDSYILLRDCLFIETTLSRSQIYTVLSNTPSVTRNEAEFDRSKFSRRTKMTNISQQQPINILEPLIFDWLLGFHGLCSVWSKPYFRYFRVFFNLTKNRFAFCHSMMSVHFRVSNAALENTASVSSCPKLNLGALKLMSLKHEILFLQC